MCKLSETILNINDVREVAAGCVRFQVCVCVLVCTLVNWDRTAAVTGHSKFDNRSLVCWKIEV